MTTMSAGEYETREHYALFNPAVVALLLARQCEGARNRDRDRYPLVLARVGAAIAFHPRLRRSLTRNIRAKLVSWIERDPHVKIDLALAVQASRAWWPRGVLFSLTSGVCGWMPPADLCVGSVPLPSVGSRTSEDLREMDEVAFFLGRWLPEAGSEATVLGLLGVRV